MNELADGESFDQKDGAFQRNESEERKSKPLPKVHLLDQELKLTIHFRSIEFPLSFVCQQFDRNRPAPSPGSVIQYLSDDIVSSTNSSRRDLADLRPSFDGDIKNCNKGQACQICQSQIWPPLSFLLTDVLRPSYVIAWRYY
jgi:hypothetical protein